jgi:hypothetical protein
MECRFINEQITYTGEQLRSHWIWEKTQILGDCIVGFFGPANVQEHLLDIVDKKEGGRILSKRMMHFICEHFNIGLELAIARQRLLVCIIAEQINLSVGTHSVYRRGDDLYHEGGKLSVSVASISPVSALIHVGVNVEKESLPIKTSSLSDLKIDPYTLCKRVLKEYKEEIKQMQQCIGKVCWTK